MGAEPRREPVDRVIAVLLENAVVWGGLFVGLALLAARPALECPLNTDAAWFLYLAREWLGGAHLYVDYLDANPPLIIFLSAPVALLGRTTGISAVAWLKLLLFIAGCVSAFASQRLIEPAVGSKREARFLGLVFVLLLLALPQSDYGQREHVMFIAVLPYLCGAASRAAGSDPDRPTRWIVGITAAVGLALKPYFLPVLPLVEGYLALASRRKHFWRAPEPIAVTAFCTAYALIVLTAMPRYAGLVRSAFGTDYLHYYDVPIGVILHSGWMIFFAVICAVEAILVLATPRRQPGAVFAIAVAAFGAAVLMQHKGFSYHFYPAMASALALAAILLLQLIHEVAALPTPLRIVGTLSTLFFLILMPLLAGALGADVLARSETWQREIEQLSGIVRRRAPNGSILVLSTRMHDAFPLVNYAGASFVGRLPSLWPLPVSLRSPPATARRLQAFVLDVVGERIASRRPDLVLVDTSPIIVPTRGLVRIDLLSFLERDPRFRVGIADYARIATVGATIVYQRRGAP